MGAAGDSKKGLSSSLSGLLEELVDGAEKVNEFHDGTKAEQEVHTRRSILFLFFFRAFLNPRRLFFVGEQCLSILRIQRASAGERACHRV